MSYFCEKWCFFLAENDNFWPKIAFFCEKLHIQFRDYSKKKDFYHENCALYA